MKLSDTTIVEIMVMGLRREGALSVDDGSARAKDVLTHLFLNKYDYDIDITFNMREFRDAKTDEERNALLDNELYMQAEKEFGAAINQRLESYRPTGRMRA